MTDKATATDPHPNRSLGLTRLSKNRKLQDLGKK